MTVTLDYKALIMLLKRKDGNVDGNIGELCKRGLDTECCVFCKVIRVGYRCSCYNLCVVVAQNEILVKMISTKFDSQFPLSPNPVHS